LAQDVTREGNRWVQTVTGTALPAARLRVNAQGPVHLEGGTANEIAYTAKFSVAVAQAAVRRMLVAFSVACARSQVATP
jgi:hypothetical protein